MSEDRVFAASKRTADAFTSLVVEVRLACITAQRLDSRRSTTQVVNQPTIGLHYAVEHMRNEAIPRLAEADVSAPSAPLGTIMQVPVQTLIRTQAPEIDASLLDVTDAAGALKQLTGPMASAVTLAGDEATRLLAAVTAAVPRKT